MTLSLHPGTTRRAFATALSGALAAAPLSARAQAAVDDWPQGDAGPLKPRLQAMWAARSGGALPALGRADAFLVARDGRIIFEAYGADHGPSTRHVSWSMAKSFTHALVGIAVGEGRVNIDAPLKLVPNPPPGLTLRSLLTLTDGLRWTEASYAPQDSDATKMIYGPGRMDGAAYAAHRGQAYPPGTRWRYSTGSFQLAAAELQLALFPQARTPEQRRATMAGYIRSRLFEPLGMRTALAEFDPSGTFIGGSLVYASARDYARFGQLYLDDGVWRGRRILPRGWVEFARTPTRAAVYGAGFWLEAPYARTKPYRSTLGDSGLYDAFSAQGHEGQLILIAPSRRLVVVHLGLMPDGPDHWAALGRWLAPGVAAFATVAKA